MRNQPNFKTETRVWLRFYTHLLITLTITWTFIGSADVVLADQTIEPSAYTNPEKRMNQEEVFLPLFLGNVQLDQSIPLEDDPFVTHVFFENRDKLMRLSHEFDIWEEAISSQPFVSIELDQAEIDALRSEGFTVEIDYERTAELNQAPRPFGHGSASIDDDPFAGAGLNQNRPIAGYSCYRTVEETFMTMSQLATNNPTLAMWTDEGDSWEKITPGGNDGYDMWVLKLTNSAIPGPKPVLMIIAAIHAREHTTAELATRYAEHLVNNYGIDPDITWLLDYNEIHIMPQANPDGRKIAEGGLLWRKNTNPTNGCSGGDFGVDLNRNSSFKWGGTGSSNDPCHQTYRGPSRASEPEVQAIQNYIGTVFTDQRGPGDDDAAPLDTEGVFITIHSYSELVLYPWGWTNNSAPNNDDLATLGRKFGYYNGYTVCNDCLYIADGVTDDYAYGEFGVASYTYELGTAFFQACSTFENQIYPDNLPTLIYAAKAARLPYQIPKEGPDSINLSLSASIVAAGTPVDLTAVIDDTRYNSGGQGIEPTQNIQGARYSIDEPSWITDTTTAMSPADGAFNSTIESAIATIDTTGLSDGQHLIFVEGQDANGNWGAPTAIYLEIGMPPASIFFDNFESDQGWTVNPNGTDTATTGIWERGDPEDTNYNGPKQLGTPFSGTNDLVTGRLAGSSVGTHDVDNGETSIRSPNITLPSSGDTTLSFSYYLAHTNNSSSADYLRVQVVGTSTQTVFEEVGDGADDDGSWATFSGSLNSFASQTVYLLISASDASNGSIVEAGIDDVRITATAPPANQPPTADAGPDQTVMDNDENGSESITLDGSGSSDPDGTIDTYEWSSDSGVTIPDGMSPTANFPVGAHTVTLTVTDDIGAIDTDIVLITVEAPAGGIAAERGTVSGVGNSGWTTVNLANSYTSMVVVTSANYDGTNAPGVVRIRNAAGSSFEVRVDNTDGPSAISNVTVHYFVVEEGVYTQATDGVTMEAVKFTSTVTDENNSWIGESRSYVNSYSSPVVLGQVMTYNDPDFSSFWARGSSRTAPPSSTTLFVGKTVSEDPDNTRVDETIGYIVVEAGSGSIGSLNYRAALGADTVRGITNSPPFSYSLSGLSSASAAIVSVAAMDGNNGGWPILYGANPVSITTLNLAYDEDQANDTERSHTTEQVAYIVFE